MNDGILCFSIATAAFICQLGLINLFTQNKQKWTTRHFLTHLLWHLTGHSSMINQLFINVGGLLQCCQKQLGLLPAAKQSFTLKLCFVIFYILVFSLFVFNSVMSLSFSSKLRPVWWNTFLVIFDNTNRQSHHPSLCQRWNQLLLSKILFFCTNLLL